MFSYHHHIGDFRRDTASLSDTDAMAYLKGLVEWHPGGHNTNAPASAGGQ